MDLKKYRFYFKKIIIIFAILLILFNVFLLNAHKFFALSQQETNLQEVYQHNNLSAFLSIEHIGIKFEEQEKKFAILILPDTGYEYNISELIAGYKMQKKNYPDTDFAQDTVYITKEDTSCVYEETCGETFEKILKSAEKYNMIPEVYDLTERIVLQKDSDNTNVFILKK